MPRKMTIAAILAALLLSGCGGAAAPMEADNANQEALYDVVENAPAGAGAVTGATDDGAESPAETEVAATEVSYFTFTRRDQNTTDDNGQTLLLERYCDSAFVSQDEDLSAFINGILDVINDEFRTNSDNLLDYASEFVEMNGSESFYSYSNYQELGIARHDESVVSLIAVSSLHSGGAHPNSVQTAYNLDIENRAVLTLEDVILESGAERLTELVIAGIREKFESLGEYGLYSDYLETVEQSLCYGVMTPYWYLNDEGLVIFYNQYELGPYAAGIIKVELSYEELEGIFVEDYLPRYSGSRGDVIVSSRTSGRRIPITIESDGEKLTVGIEGRVFQIQLSEVYWLEQTPIMQEILFSAGTMSSGDLIEVIGGYTDDGRSFAIEFIDPAGEGHIYYLHDSSLSEEP